LERRVVEDGITRVMLQNQVGDLLEEAARKAVDPTGAIESLKEDAEVIGFEGNIRRTGGDTGHKTNSGEKDRTKKKARLS